MTSSRCSEFMPPITEHMAITEHVCLYYLSVQLTVPKHYINANILTYHGLVFPCRGQEKKKLRQKKPNETKLLMF